MLKTKDRWETIAETLGEIGDGLEADEDQPYYDLSELIWSEVDDNLYLSDDLIDIQVKSRAIHMIAEAERLIGE